LYCPQNLLESIFRRVGEWAGSWIVWMNEGRENVEELVLRAQSGDVEAFEALYRQNQAGIYAFIGLAGAAAPEAAGRLPGLAAPHRRKPGEGRGEVGPRATGGD
jgi:hypothetical protein